MPPQGEQSPQRLPSRVQPPPVDGWMIIIQNNTSKVEYAYLVVVVECVHMGGGSLPVPVVYTVLKYYKP